MPQTLCPQYMLCRSCMACSGTVCASLIDSAAAVQVRDCSVGPERLSPWRRMVAAEARVRRPRDPAAPLLNAALAAATPWQGSAKEALDLQIAALPLRVSQGPAPPALLRSQLRFAGFRILVPPAERGQQAVQSHI